MQGRNPSRPAGARADEPRTGGLGVLDGFGEPRNARSRIVEAFARSAGAAASKAGSSNRGAETRNLDPVHLPNALRMGPHGRGHAVAAAFLSRGSNSSTDFVITSGGRYTSTGTPRASIGVLK